MKQIKILHALRVLTDFDSGRFRSQPTTENQTRFPVVLIRIYRVDPDVLEKMFSGFQRAEIHFRALSGPSWNLPVVAEAPIENSGKIHRNRFYIISSKIILEIQRKMPCLHRFRMFLFRKKPELIVFRFAPDKLAGAEQIEISGNREISMRIQDFHLPRLSAEYILFLEKLRHGNLFPIHFHFNFPVQGQFNAQEEHFAWNRFLPGFQTYFPEKVVFRFCSNGFFDSETVKSALQGELISGAFRISGIRLNFRLGERFPCRIIADQRKTVASIKANGVMVPGLARPEKDGNGYEIVAGHRRHHGCELAGLEEMPFIVREMTDHEAVQAMKDSNKQRDQTLPSELAALLELEVEDIKHQGGRLKNVAEGDIGKRSVEIVGEAHDMNYKKVMRYLRLNSLVPELLDKVDDKKMGFMPAVEISYIRPKNQRLIAVSIDGEQASPSLAQAKKLRELDKDGKLNGDVIDGILSEKKKEDRGVIISTAELEKYFGKEVTPAKMKEQIMTLLDEWKEKQPPELAKAPKKMEQDK